MISTVKKILIFLVMISVFPIPMVLAGIGIITPKQLAIGMSITSIVLAGIFYIGLIKQSFWKVKQIRRLIYLIMLTHLLGQATIIYMCY